MAFQRFLCVAERSTLTQSLQRQRSHTDREGQGSIISNSLEGKRGRDLWCIRGRCSTGLTDKYEKPPTASKTCYKGGKQWDAGVHLPPIFRLRTHEPARMLTTQSVHCHTEPNLLSVPAAKILTSHIRNQERLGLQPPYSRATVR